MPTRAEGIPLRPAPASRPGIRRASTSRNEPSLYGDLSFFYGRANGWLRVLSAVYLDVDEEVTNE